MKVSAKCQKNKNNGIISFDMPFKSDSRIRKSMLTGYGKFSLPNEAVEKEEDEAEFDNFNRSDLIFYGINEMDESYEVSIFINNSSADASTERSFKNGFAGMFTVFGHGGCYGGYGHCEIPIVKGKYNPHIEHPSSKPNRINVDITTQLKKVLSSDQKSINVKLVPSCPHLTNGEKTAAESFKRPKKIELVFYN